MKHCQFKEWKKSLQYIHFRGKESLSLLDFWFELLKKHCSLKVQLFYMYCSSFLSCFKQSSLSRIVVNGRLEMLFFFQAQFYTPSCNGMPASGYIQERLLNIQRGISQQKKRASNHKSKPPGKKPRTVFVPGITLYCRYCSVCMFFTYRENLSYVDLGVVGRAEMLSNQISDIFNYLFSLFNIFFV